jgi:hypothetical protein
MAALRARDVRQVPRLTAVGKKAKAAKRSRKQQFAERMVAEQQRTAEVLQSLSTAVGESQLPSGDRLLEEIRRLLDDVLVAQHRTNHLLELALRAGFDDEEQARNP